MSGKHHDGKNPPPSEGDGIVEGNENDNLIDVNYTGDPEGDRIDNNDGKNGTVGDEDLVVAGKGDDTVKAGEADDIVFGGGGDDKIYGEGGDDVLFGDGPNTATFKHDDEEDDEEDDDEKDDNGGGELKFGPGGPDGDDCIDGGKGNDLIYGMGGHDTLKGGEGADTILGGKGDDLIIGGAGKDVLSGGAGRDTFIGGNPGDKVDGGTEGEGGNVPGGDYDTLDLSAQKGFVRLDESSVTVDPDGDSISGKVEFLDDEGNVTGTLKFHEIENLVICFTPGSAIATPRGEVAVEDLRVGDRVITRDDGVQDIQWIGRKKLDGKALIADPQLRPVLIKAGALGHDLPERDMLVSPNHRMLMANRQTHILFDEREVLVAAKHLVGQPGITQIDSLGVEYIHVMFERHQVILGNGSWTESFQPGDHSLRGIDQEQRDEIFKLFPNLANAEGRGAYRAARQSLKAHEARMLRQTLAAE